MWLWICRWRWAASVARVALWRRRYDDALKGKRR